MAIRKKRVEEVYYYPRIFRFETGLPDPKYFDDVNVNSRAEGFADSPRFSDTYARQLAAEKADAKNGEEVEQIIVIDAFGDHPQLVDAPSLGEELFLKTDLNPGDEIQYLPDDDEPDNLFL